MNLFGYSLLLFSALLAGACAFQQYRPAEVERGKYLVEIMGCNDCHTPGYMTNGDNIPEEDWLVGDTLGYHGSWGTAYPTNLRLLLNRISADEWIAMARKMRRQSPMAWSKLPNANDEDLHYIYEFIVYLGPKGEPVPDRFPPGVTPETRFINFPEPH